MRECLPITFVLHINVQHLGITNSHGLFNFAQATLPLLLASVDASPPSPPTLLVTGATASLRGGVKFADFAAGKFAKRALAQSLAREFGPRGVHVAHVVVDGAIDIPRLADFKAKINDGKPDGLLSPDAVGPPPPALVFFVDHLLTRLRIDCR